MNRFFSPQRAASGARIFSKQAGTGQAPTPLTVDQALTSATTIVTGGVREAIVLIDLPAPRSRCIFMEAQNRTIRL